MVSVERQQGEHEAEEEDACQVGQGPEAARAACPPQGGDERVRDDTGTNFLGAIFVVRLALVFATFKVRLHVRF